MTTSIRCPHCNVRLKVDKDKIPVDIEYFTCPKCKGSIPVSILDKTEDEAETVVIRPPQVTRGKLIVLANDLTPSQELNLHEGLSVIGRKSDISSDNIGVETKDKLMSRKHIRIEIKKDAQGNYIHYLSDNNSKNKTLYNSNYLNEGEVVILKDNDEITIGRTVLLFKK